MFYTKESFTKELFDLRHEYRKDNAWVQGWRKWDDDGIMQTFVDGAFNLYSATATNRLNLTLLGDTEIRSIASLITNFGLVSGNGVQEKEDERMVKNLEQRRKQVAMGTKEGLGQRVKVLGPGSILSDKMWTPILNDALMIGAMEGRQEFHLALNTTEQAAWANAGFNSAVKDKAKAFGGSVSTSRNAAESNWNSFFRKQPQMIWRAGTPRVFARELLGLKFFGYKPVFSHLELGFAPGAGVSIGQPGFRAYTSALRGVGFFENAQPRIMGAIGEFLFNNNRALL
jgi:hypothetical protein